MRRVFHDAALTHLTRLQFELRLYQAEQSAPGLEQRYKRWQDQGLRDERQIDHDQITCGCERRLGNLPIRWLFLEQTLVAGAGGKGIEQVLGLQIAGIDVLHAEHAGIGAQLRVELGAAHIHAAHKGRTILQQAIGKPAGGLAHVQAAHACHVQPHHLQRVFQLEAAARHIACLRVVQEPDLRRIGHLVAVFRDPLPRIALQPFNPVGNQPLRLRPRARHVPANQQLVNTHTS